ncbi:MAG: DUF5979 domain-containing protein [Clostridiales bacterium]|nr:DUF5979 domain-containing protein [Clostridiales bacterium]
MKKKLLSLALAAVMVMSLSATALASEVTKTEEQTVTASISKMYTLTNSDTKSPADTFKFTVENYSVKDAADGVTVNNMPTPSITDISVLDGDATVDGTSHGLSITLPSYSSVGVYTYKITETDNKLAGVTYSTTDYYLIVTVTQENGVLSVSSYYLHSGSVDGIKTDDIDNTYSAGSLNVTKTVNGNLGDKTKKFEFTVTFTAPADKTVAWSLVTGTVAGQTVTFDLSTSQTYTFELADGETATFSNLPYGVTYIVTETADSGYRTTQTGNEGEINSGSATAAFINTKDGDVDTGINLDTLPYIMILAVVFAGAAYMVIRKRMSDRY